METILDDLANRRTDPYSVVEEMMAGEITHHKGRGGN